MRAVRILSGMLLLLVVATTALAEERFPPPDFTDHTLPQTVVPPARSPAMEYVDLAALLVGLSAATFFALKTRSRKGLFVLAILSLVWLGFWRKGCVCSIGAIQNVALGVFDPSYTIPLAVVGFFVLPLLFTLFFGRTFCAAVCPLGVVQELVALRPVRVPAWLDHALGLLAYVYLGLAVLFAATGTAFVICWYDPFVGFFRLGGSINMLILGGCFLAVGIFVGRPYCRYLCPYGAILGLLSKVSKWHVQIPPDDCIQCRLCEESCPYGAIREPTVDQTPAHRRRGRARLAALLVLAPVLVVVGAWLGTGLEVPLSKVDFHTVRLAERIRMEDTKQVDDTTDASDAFRNTGRPTEELYDEAFRRTKLLGVAGGWFGAWVGLVIGVKLIYLSVRRRRTDFTPDRSSCVACGRCFWYCPGEQVRRGLIQEIDVRELSGSPS